MTNRPPEKPKNYWRDYSIIIILAFIPLPIALYFDIKYIIPLLPIFIVTVLPLFWFRSYYAELSRYKELNTTNTKPKVNIESRVNENIARYVEEQKERKELAKWWQFWI